MRTVRFFKGVYDTMKQDLNLPADYAVLSDNEMTYTQGGGVFTTLLGLYTAGATAVGTGVLAASYAWGIQQTRDWLKQPGNKKDAATAASGNPMLEGQNAGLTKTGVYQGYIEASNVQVADEMVNMIIAQRAYELNSKAITTSDSMLEIANGLKR